MRRHWLLPILLGWGGLALAGPLDAMLERFGQGLRERDFSGVLVYARDGQLDALRVRHSAQPGQDLIERLTGPELPLERAEGVARLGSLAALGFRSVAGDAMPRPEPERFYAAARVGDDRVAGRQVEVFDLRAADALRYSRRFWIDRETGLLLRAAVYAADGSLVEQWLFASIDFEPPRPTQAPPVPARELRAPGSADLARVRLAVLDVPPGFRLVSAAVDADSEQQVFSDGVARVSLFAQPLGSEAAILSGHQRRGALSVFGRVFRGLQIVVVGEVPAATAERFAQSVDLRHDG